MKRNIKSIIFVAFLASMLFLGILPKAQAQECSLATLQGEYLVTGGAEARFDQRDDPSFPRRAIAVWTFDGNGGFTTFGIQSSGGVTVRSNLMGTYTMDSERCVATLTFAVGGAQFDTVITRDGSEGAAIRVDADEQGRTIIGTRFMKKR